MSEGSISSRLLQEGQKVLQKIPKNDNHNVVAAALTHDDKIITAFNVFHFTGGPCAEPAVLGAAAAQGYLPKDLTHMVAVARRHGRVLNPCGRCRQMLIDLCPDIRVVIKDDGDEIRVVTVKELLPFAYLYPVD